MAGPVPPDIKRIARALPGFHEDADQAWERRCRDLELRLHEQGRILAAAAAALATEMQRREDAQAALLQAQKLEALGHLTSGVAHDFNNVLQAISSTFEILSQDNQDPFHLKAIGNGRQAVRQAMELSRRLLTFGRQDQSLPSIVDPAALLAGVEELICHLVDSRTRCSFAADPGVWPVLVDVRKLEPVLMNLAVNARDAMPDGGRIEITARNHPASEAGPSALAAGDHVVFSVRDTGTGMPPEVVARAADPFFTTKGPERGTGLGLTMAQAFARQAGGLLTIDSRVGEGTLVEIFLPRAVPGALVAPAAHRGGVILLAEGNEALRQSSADALRRLGYRVIEAGDAQVALVLSYTLEGLDLVIAGTALPGGSGRELAGHLRIERPGLPALLLADGGSPNGADPVLMKPFGLDALAAAVADRLASRDSHAERETVLSQRMMARLKSPQLRQVYAAWRGARGSDLLPRLEQARSLLAEHHQRHFVAAVDGGSQLPRFRFLSLGTELTGLLGYSLDGDTVDGSWDEATGSLAATYARSARSMLPVYDYARFACDDGPPTTFERLTMPIAEDGQTISHLIGVVLFSDFPARPNSAP